MGKKTQIAIMTVSVLALCAALYANYVAAAAIYTAHEANRIAEQSVQIAHQINAPLISAITKIRRDDSKGSATEEVRINNGGAPLHEFSAEVYEILSVYFKATDEQIFVIGWLLQRTRHYRE